MIWSYRAEKGMSQERQRVLAKELEDRLTKRTGFEKSFVSRTHTQGCIAVAWAPSPIGIDVEAVDKEVKVEFKNMLPLHELKYLESDFSIQGHSISAKLCLWCGHEAFFKYCSQLGGQSECSLEELSATGDGWRARVEMKDGRKFDPRIKLYHRNGFLLAICSAQEEFAGDELFGKVVK